MSCVVSAADGPWRVVILSGTDPTLPAFVAIDRAMRGALNAPGTHPVELYLESLDTMRFPGAQIEPEMLALLKKKYAKERVDAVIAVVPAGLAFAERHRDDIWPGAAIVFHSVAENELRGRTLAPRTTGIPARFDMAGTADLALRLRPSTRRLVVIGGSGDYDRYVLAIAREQLGSRRKDVDIEYWTDRRFDDLTRDTAQLPADAAILILSIGRDAAGRTFTARDAAALLARSASVPMFAIYDTFMGTGVVAGMVDNYAWRGERVAKHLVDTLASGADSPMPVPAVVPSECVADARELTKWNLSQDRLPPGCTVRFGEPTALQRYRWQIALAFAIIASQSVLIAALVLQRRRRRHAEVETQAARAELTHAARLASMGELTASIAHEIKQPLSAILAHADTAELLLETDVPPLPEIQRILAEIRKDDLRASDVITRLRDLLGRHEMERRPVDLNDAIRNALAVVEAEARQRDVTVVTQLAPDLPPVVGDDVHLQQVVLNLVLNAMDAVAGVEQSARRISVGTRAVANGVQITVADDGPGIDPAISSRLFESFVTTKSRGLGLGLSIARTIVEAHGGTIGATGDAGHGAVFRVVLPAAPPERDVMRARVLSNSLR
jgi:signal transduction histidine kinase